MAQGGELVARQCIAAAYSERVSDPSYSFQLDPDRSTVQRSPPSSTLALVISWTAFSAQSTPVSHRTRRPDREHQDPVDAHLHGPDDRFLAGSFQSQTVPAPGAEKEDNLADLLTMEEILPAKTWKLLLSCSHQTPLPRTFAVQPTLKKPWFSRHRAQFAIGLHFARRFPVLIVSNL